MIPDTASTFLDLSEGVSKPNFLPDFIYSGIEDYLDFSEFDNLLHSDSSSINFEDDFDRLDDDDIYEEKPNLAALEAAALKTGQASFSTELCHIVNPNDIFSSHVFKKEPELCSIVNPNDIFFSNHSIKKEPELCHVVNPNEIFPDHFIKKEVVEVTDEVVVNNSRVDQHHWEYEYVKRSDEVHNDHSYVKEGFEKPEEGVRIKQEVESDDEYLPPRSVLMKVDPPVKRPVGRPRKNPIATKQLKRTAVYLEDAISDEYVDVESLDVKRPHKKGKKSRSRQRSRSHQSPDPFNPNGYVMRQAKTSALKKITKTRKSTPAPRSKRSDHNDMERKRRHEMRDLFEQLKRLIPVSLLVDENNKAKKNPSKNTILCGSQRYVKILYATKIQRNLLVAQKHKLQKKHRRLVKSLRKYYRRRNSRNYIC